MKLYLARHAESLANVAHVIACEIPGPALSELGRQQATSLADRMESAGISAIYHSRMLRTRQTAEPLAERLGLELQELPGLHEVQLGDLAERDDKQAYDEMDVLATAWNMKKHLDLSRPGGESGAQVVERMTESFDRVRAENADGGAVLAVAHGLCLRTAAQRWADGVSLDFAFRNLLPNASVIEVDVPAEGRPRILQWAGLDPSDTEHEEGGVL